MNSSLSLNCDEQVLLPQLPEVAWRLVLESLGAKFAILETLSQATPYLGSLISGNGQVSLGNKQIQPSVVREWIRKSERKYDSQSEPMLLLLTLVDVKPRLTAFEIFVDRKFRPTNRVLNSLLKLQSESLETLYISCVGLESDPVIVDLTDVEMGRVRDLKIIRSVTGIRVRQFGWECQKSLYFDLPERKSFPALEKITLSLGYLENWNDFFVMWPGHKDYVPVPRVEKTRVRHVRFIDLPTRTTQKCWKDESGNAMSGALKAFPDLLSLEIPAMQFHKIRGSIELFELKRLTITLPKVNRHKHVFDMCITGYGRKVCDALFADPTRDPLEVRESIRKVIEIKVIHKTRTHNRVVFDNNCRRSGTRKTNLTHFSKLEVLKIKSKAADWGPTIVSCPDLLDMKSLKVLDFCGVKPIHIPDEMIQRMRQQLTVLCE